MVIDFAIKEFGLPVNLKMSVHSGSDKFSIYSLIGSIINKHNKGIHLKTAGTTWLEELIGLAESGGEALDFVKEYIINLLRRLKNCVHLTLTLLILISQVFHPKLKFQNGTAKNGRRSQAYTWK